MSSVAAMDLFRLEKNDKLETKLVSLERRLGKLNSLIEVGRYGQFRKKAMTLLRIEKVLFKRFEKNNQQDLEPVTKGLRARLKELRSSQDKAEFATEIISDLKSDKQLLENAIQSAKSEILDIDMASSGLFGRVTLLEGDCMPSTNPNTCKASKLATRVIIRSSDDSELIAETQSNEAGYYQIDLAPGLYSVFVDDNGEEYCNSFDGNGLACGVDITDGSKLEYDVVINHATW